MKKTVRFFSLLAVMLIFCTSAAAAANSIRFKGMAKSSSAAKTETSAVLSEGYRVIIEDDAGLIMDTDALYKAMEPVTEYGSVMFKSVDINDSTTMELAYKILHDNFGYDNGTLLLIDMDNRNIYIRSDGQIIDRLNNTKSEIITDNIYTYASAGDYDTCAVKAFEQIYAVLSGYAIAEPMHIIGIALISLLTGMIICFILVNKVSVKHSAREDELLEGTDTSIIAGEPVVRYIRTKATKIQSSSGGSDGGSSGGGFSGGGSSGGGGFSGSGGGHSF